MQDVSSHTRFRSGYRSAFHFGLDKDETASDAALRHVQDWLGEDGDDALRSALYNWEGDTSIALPNGTVVSVFAFTDDRSGDQIIRYRVVEDGDSGPLQVTLSAFNYQRGKDLNATFVIEAANTAQSSEDAMATVATPTLVANVLNDRKVSDSQTRLQGNPRVMHEHDDLYEVVRAIADPKRQVAVTVAASPGISEDARWNEVVNDLTRDSRGVAASFVVTANAVEMMNDLLPKHLRVAPGHVRTFAPRVDFENPDDQVRHRDLSPAALAEALEADGAVSESLVRNHASGPRRSLLEQPLPTAARRKLKFLDAQERSARIEELVKERQARREEEPVESETVEIPSYPSRKDLHNGRSDGDREWILLRDRMASWLEVEDVEISEATLEGHIEDLDARILADRKKLSQLEEAQIRVEAYQEYLAEIEQGREELESQLAQEKRLREEALQETAVYQQYLEDNRILNAYYRDQLQHSDIKHSVDPASLKAEEWEAPRSLPLLLELLVMNEGERVTGDRIVFTGDNAVVEQLSLLDPLGIYAHETWGIIRTLHDYLRAKDVGARVDTVEEYLLDDAIAGYKISARRHIVDTERQVKNLALWKSDRTFAVPANVSSSGEIYMDSHFRVGHGSGISPRLYYFDNSGPSGDGRIYVGYIGQRITREDQVGPEVSQELKRKPFKAGENGATLDGKIQVQDGLLSNPAAVVFEALTFLSEHLDPIIQRRFEYVLQGREWTEILSQMDRARGRTGMRYSTSDTQAQLRMLTERIGTMGYPFDQAGTRVSSTHAQALRGIRNRSAHNDRMDDLDAFRTYDHIALLLEELEDDAGAAEARRRRQALFTNMHDAAQERVIGNIKEKDKAVEEVAEVPIQSSHDEEEDLPEATPVTPSHIVGARRGADTPILGDTRFEYEAWTPSMEGDYSVLDIVESGNAPAEVQQRIRVLAEEIVDFEGPVAMERLGSLIGQEHQHARLGRRKRNAIEGLIRGADVYVDEQDFVWPRAIDPHSWREFRPNASDVSRPFDFVSMAEIRNAARFIQEENPQITGEALADEVLRTFGRRRRTKKQWQRLQEALGAGLEDSQEEETNN